MIALASHVHVVLHRPATDMRKSFSGLVALIESAMGQDPLSGNLFVLVNVTRSQPSLILDRIDLSSARQRPRFKLGR